MPDTPPNPDALASAVSGYQYRVHCARGAEHCPACQGVVEAIIHDYLAAAQPEVNSVEELDALPEGSVFIDGDGEVCQIEIDGESHFNGDPYRRFSIVGDYKDHELDEAIFPTRVLYRPEVDDA